MYAPVHQLARSAASWGSAKVVVGSVVGAHPCRSVGGDGGGLRPRRSRRPIRAPRPRRHLVGRRLSRLDGGRRRTVRRAAERRAVGTQPAVSLRPLRRGTTAGVLLALWSAAPPPGARR